MSDLPPHWSEPAIRRGLDLPPVHMVDLRLVVGRDGALVATIEGRRVVGLPVSNDVAIVLAALSRRVEGAAWSAARPTLEEVTDAASPLFNEVTS